MDQTWQSELRRMRFLKENKGKRDEKNFCGADS